MVWRHEVGWPFEKAKPNRFCVPTAGLFINFVVGAIIFLPFPGWQKLVGFISSAAIQPPESSNRRRWVMILMRRPTCPPSPSLPRRGPAVECFHVEGVGPSEADLGL